MKTLTCCVFALMVWLPDGKNNAGVYDTKPLCEKAAQEDTWEEHGIHYSCEPRAVRIGR